MDSKLNNSIWHMCKLCKRCLDSEEKMFIHLKTKHLPVDIMKKIAEHDRLSLTNEQETKAVVSVKQDVDSNREKEVHKQQKEDKLLQPTTLAMESTQRKSDDHDPNLKFKTTIGATTKMAMTTRSANKSSIKQPKTLKFENSTPVAIRNLEKDRVIKIKASTSPQFQPTSVKINSDPSTPKQSQKKIKTETVKRFKCSYCSSAFKEKWGLIVHTRIHTGEKPYKCSKCAKSFAQLTNLNNHQRTHTGKKPFQCKTCLKCFAQVSNLNFHVRLHTGEKPYKCKKCKLAFTQIANLNSHVAKCS